MYGLGRAKYRGNEVGYIEKGSFDLGGKKPEAAEMEAEQVPGAAVLIIPQKNGTISPTFNMIQLNYDNLEAMLGGSVHKKTVEGKEETVGWTAPEDVIVLDGPWELELVSGQSVLIPNATLLSDLGGKLALTESAKIECELKLAAPEVKGVPPYGIFDSDSLPEEWTGEKYLLPKKETAAAPEPVSAQQENGHGEPGQTVRQED
ncbi:hypothetical protein [Xylanibacter muris]|uniref:hypothetical protein n=1 Tax=Xylanibacter muris TaxID=2736290 RepID=UPI0025A20AA5|nr:hypothetical protein [Xylanibacter muris]